MDEPCTIESLRLSGNVEFEILKIGIACYFKSVLSKGLAYAKISKYMLPREMKMRGVLHLADDGEGVGVERNNRVRDVNSPSSNALNAPAWRRLGRICSTHISSEIHKWFLLKRTLYPTNP